MLNTFIIVSLLLNIISLWINGITVYGFMLIIPFMMFSLRKFAIHISFSNIIAAECLLLFFSTSWRLLFHNFDLLTFVGILLIRAIFIIIVTYDDLTFVYVSEERRRVSE